MEQERAPFIPSAFRLRAMALRTRFTELLGKESQSPNDLIWSLLNRIAPAKDSRANVHDLRITHLVPFLELLYKAHMTLDTNRAVCIESHIKFKNLDRTALRSYPNPFHDMDLAKPKCIIVPPDELRVWMRELRTLFLELANTLCHDQRYYYDLNSGSFKKIRESTIAFSRK